MMVTPLFSFSITSPQILKQTSNETTQTNPLHSGTAKDNRPLEKSQDYGFGHTQTPKPVPRTDTLHE